jgi:hypothetical protein
VVSITDHYLLNRRCIQFVTLFVAVFVTNWNEQTATLSIKRSIQVSANIISGQTRIGETMKKKIVLTTLIVLALALAIGSAGAQPFDFPTR